MTNRIFTSVMLCLVIIGAGAPLPAAAQDFQQVDIRIEEIPDSTLERVVATAWVDADVETVWRQISTYENYGTQNAMLDVTYVAPEENAQREVHISAGFPGLLPSLKCQFYFTRDDKAHAVTWVRKEGCFKHNTGSLVVTADGDRTLVTFAAEVEIGKVLPVWAANWAVKHNIPIEIDRIRHDSKAVWATASAPAQ